MASPALTIYRSSNGDIWLLVRDPASGAHLVRHEANPSSGGHATEMPAEDFLALGGAGPEHAALRRIFADRPGAS